MRAGVRDPLVLAREPHGDRHAGVDRTSQCHDDEGVADDREAARTDGLAWVVGEAGAADQQEVEEEDHPVQVLAAGGRA